MLKDPHFKSNIKPGSIVKISLISDQKEITGKVSEILSPLEYHPLGIRVVLDDDNNSEGRIIEIVTEPSPIDNEVLKKISQDESLVLEFKASLLTPKDTIEETMKKYKIKNQKDAEKKLHSESKEIIHSSMKTIGGFANTDGGELFIGIEDRTGNIIGLERDFQKVEGTDGDGFLVELKNQIKSHFNGTGIFATIPVMEIIEIEGKSICHIQVSPSTAPSTISEKLEVNGQTYPFEKFYVRVSNSTEEFTPRDFYEKHWPLHLKKYLSSTQIVL